MAAAIRPIGPMHERVTHAHVASTLTSMSARPRLDGKFLSVDGQRFLVKGVTYGTFAPDARGYQFPDSEQIAAVSAQMASHGINTVRTYTLPDRALLDEAARQGLRVMAGVPWSQHIAFLADRKLCREIRQ